MTCEPASRASGSRFPRRRAPILSLCAALALGGCGYFGQERAGDIPPAEFLEPNTGIEYEVEVVGAPNEEVTDLLEQTLLLYRRQDKGAPSRPILKRRAEEDVASAVKVLKSFGYYEPVVTVEVEDVASAPPPARDAAAAQAQERQRSHDISWAELTGKDAAPEAEETAEPDGPKPMALAKMIIEPGPAFTLIRHDFELVDVPAGPPVELPSAGQMGSPVGGPADAATILESEAKVLTALLNQGRPWAKLQGRRAVADLEADTIAVQTRINPGPYAEYGRIKVEGLDHVEPGFVNTYRVWRRDQPVDRRQLREYQRDLMATELFDSVIVDVSRTPPEDGAGPVTPVTVTVEEAKRRSVSAGLRFDTSQGPSVEGGFVHRNLWGEGERLTIDITAGLQDQIFTTELRKPQFLRRRQDLTFDFQASHEEQDAYDETSVLGGAGIERRIRRYWTVGTGGAIEYSHIVDDGGDDDVLLFSAPSFVGYDGSDDLLNPTEGVRVTLYGTPFLATRDTGTSPFLKAETVVTGYLPFDEAKKYVLAARGRVGSILSDNFSDVPATKRFYSGGGGSVRGYEQDYIGPLDLDNDPVGGRSVLEAGLEMRAMVWGPIGIVGFAEAGAVSDNIYPDTVDSPQYAAGFGVRYYSPVGPIRADVAFPLNPRPVDDPFAFYFSIGQAY